MNPDKYRPSKYGEARTTSGQVVTFACPADVFDEVSKLIKHIIELDIPTTGRVNISHGGYGKYTRYDVTQHDYAGGGFSYIEVLEIKNPPDDRCGIVINEFISSRGSAFTEWETLEDARNAFKKYCVNQDNKDNFSKCKGFKRRVMCGAMNPWFYAVGNEQLLGDYTFPDGLQDDPVYRFGRKFVVSNNGILSVKTCMGTRFIKKTDSFHPYKEHQYRVVHWNDGSMWDELNHHSCGTTDIEPRPIEDGELWITEAIQRFHQLLAGRSTDFSIDFVDGNKFVGKLNRKNNRNPCAEGSYFLIVHLKGGGKPRQGWVDFKPTVENPDIIQFVTKRFASNGLEVERIEIKESKTEKGGKKWAGVFFNRS